jgi:hypothetical protein
MARYLNAYLLDVERETNALIDAKPSRTYTINRLSDLPAPNASGQIQLDGTSHYQIRSDIDIGSNQIVAYLGTKISGEIAQRDIIRSSNATSVITCDGGGVFTTFIIEGIIQLINSAGNGIYYEDNAYLIMFDCLMSTPNTKSAVIANGGAAVQIRGWTPQTSNIGLDVRGSMAFGSIVDRVNTNTLSGVGLKFGDNGATSNVGILQLSNLNFTSAGDAIQVNGKSTSILMTDNRMVTTAGNGFVINNTVGNKVDNLFVSNINISATGGNAFDMSAGYIDSASISKGLMETKTGANFAIKGVSTSSNISTRFGIDGVTLRNTVTTANILSGITIKDTRVRFENCPGVGDTKQQGSCYITTSGDTQASVSTTYLKVTPSVSSTAGELSKFTHTSPYKLTYNGIEPYVGRVGFDASIAQNSGTAKKIFLAIYKNGTQLTPTNQTFNGGDSANNRTVPISITADVTLNTNDYVELYVKIESGTQTITYDVLNFRCEDSL